MYSYSEDHREYPGIHVVTTFFVGTINHPVFTADHYRRRNRFPSRRWDDRYDLDAVAVELVRRLVTQ